MQAPTQQVRLERNNALLSSKAKMQKGKGSQSREGDLAQMYQTPGQCTTFMLRNIPPEYTQDDLINEVSEAMGATDLFDFFYLPWDSSKGRSAGYAFVNFHNTIIASKAFKIFSNFRFRLSGGRVVGKVLPAHIQGLENNLRHLQFRAVAHMSHPFRPVVMWKGQKVELSVIFEELRLEARDSADAAPLFGRVENSFAEESPEGHLMELGHGSSPGSSSSRRDLAMQVSRTVNKDFAQLLDRAARRHGSSPVNGSGAQKVWPSSSPGVPRSGRREGRGGNEGGEVAAAGVSCSGQMWPSQSPLASEWHGQFSQGGATPGGSGSESVRGMDFFSDDSEMGSTVPPMEPSAMHNNLNTLAKRFGITGGGSMPGRLPGGRAGSCPGGMNPQANMNRIQYQTPLSDIGPTAPMMMPRMESSSQNDNCGPMNPILSMEHARTLPAMNSDINIPGGSPGMVEGVKVMKVRSAHEDVLQKFLAKFGN